MATKTSWEEIFALYTLVGKNLMFRIRSHAFRGPISMVTPVGNEFAIFDFQWIANRRGNGTWGKVNIPDLVVPMTTEVYVLEPEHITSVYRIAADMMDHFSPHGSKELEVEMTIFLNPLHTIHPT